MARCNCLAVLLLLACAAAGVIGADDSASCLAKAEKKFEATVSRAAAELTAQSTTCAALQPVGGVAAAGDGPVEAAAAQPTAPARRPSCPKACQYGLCLARCYIDRISLYPDGCKVYDCVPGCTKSIDFKCATGRLG